MSLRELVIKARSYRRFREDKDVDLSVLTGIVDTVRFVPSSINMQPLRYAISVNRDVNAKIFPLLAWARQLKDWKGPEPGERPSAYIVIAGSVAAAEKHLIVDLGIACQTLFLGLTEASLCGCMIGNLNAQGVHGMVGFPDEYKVVQVMAVGYPGETVILEELPPGGATPYWRDAEGAHHVPKRRLDEVLMKTFR